MGDQIQNDPQKGESNKKSENVLTTALGSGATVKKLELSIEELREAMKPDGEGPQGIIPICSQCHRVRDRDGVWHHIEARLLVEHESCFSHGLCQRCASLLFGNFVVSG